ncbi:MAG: hypothetical protein WC867_02335 [Candidatus Pacearchaeota archaeon]|jgi:hypothetical protein
MRDLLKAGNRLRRIFFKKIKKDYIKNKLEKRKGYCKKCGDCCKGCKHLSKENLCLVYDKRPWWCHKEFPIDKIDQKVFNVKRCGYNFKN